MNTLNQLPRELLIKQIENGLVLLGIGLGTVFLFLIILIGIVKLQSYLINRFRERKSIISDKESNQPAKPVLAVDVADTDDGFIETAKEAAPPPGLRQNQSFIHIQENQSHGSFAAMQYSVVITGNAPSSVKSRHVEGSKRVRQEPGTQSLSTADEASLTASSSGGLMVKAPMPGLVLRIQVKEGDKVAKNDLLLVMEAMKMENEIFAPIAGTVAKVCVKPGDQFMTDDELVYIS